MDMSITILRIMSSGMTPRIGTLIRKINAGKINRTQERIEITSGFFTDCLRENGQQEG
jgi:hypothetical protein